MIYRTLGRTGLRVSQLGFGAMRLPMHTVDGEKRVNRELAIPMIRRALDEGVNYVDTAVMYCEGDSQRAVGEALEGRRSDVVLSTKNHCYSDDEREWWQHLEDSLTRLRTDYIDIYNHHGVRWARMEDAVLPRLSKWMQKAKDQGLIRHICCSFHDTNENLVKVIETGYPDVLTVQYNLLDRSLEEGIARAHEAGIGIVVMGPVAGGRLGVPSDSLRSVLPDVQRVPELALRFVLANPNVSIALSGMSTMEQVEENLGVASDARKLTPEQLDAIETHMARLKEMADLYCSGCGYCMPCPKGVDIPQVFQLFNMGRVYDLWGPARQRYRRQLLSKEKGADQCVNCGACEPKCPQNLKIREELQRAHQALAPANE